MDHYYSEKPVSKSEITEITEVIRGLTFRFRTDHSVFARRRVDQGSKVLLESLRLKEDARVLDLGTGYGVLGVVASRMVPRGAVLMLDINERALALARENVVLNNCANTLVQKSDGFSAISRAKYDAILLNPPIRAGKQTYYPWLAQSRDFLTSSGQLWVVIQPKQGASSLKAYLQEIFPVVEITDRRSGYWIITATV